MKLSRKRVLVTGGAGFIGSHLCERLLKEGAEVVVLDNFCTAKPDNLELIKDQVQIMEGSVENWDDVSTATKGCDIVIHQAFPHGKSGMGLNEQYTEAGALGTFNVLKAAVENRVEKFVYASTVAVYGIPNYLPIDEDHPVNPFLVYGANKYVGELYCSTFARLYGLNTISLRYFYVYGPRYAQFDHSAMVNFLHRALENKPLLIYGDGSQVRDYTYIDDVVDGTILAVTTENTPGGVYNISSGKGITISELAQKIASTLDQDIEIRLAEISEYRHSDDYCVIPVGMTTKSKGKWIDERNYVADISRANRDLGYNPVVGLEEGIKKTFEWLQGLKTG